MIHVQTEMGYLAPCRPILDPRFFKYVAGSSLSCHENGFHPKPFDSMAFFLEIASLKKVPSEAAPDKDSSMICCGSGDSYRLVRVFALQSQFKGRPGNGRNQPLNQGLISSSHGSIM
jgi:hypothetical protein